MRLTRTALLAAVGLLCSSPALVAAEGHAAPAVAAGVQTCDGQPATIVGTPGEHLEGTSGPDVIVTNGATTVYAAEGEDLVCMTGGDTSVMLDGDTEGDGAGTWAQDRVIGTGGDDEVVSGNFADLDDLSYDDENLDDIDLGSGDSTVIVVGAPVGSLQGGAGRDRLILQGSGSTASDVLTIDAAGGTLGFTGHGPATLSSFESFHLDESSYTDLDFTGTDAAEAVYTHQKLDDEFSVSGPQRVAVALGGGDDVFTIGDQKLSGSVTGGAGADQFRQINYSRANATASQGRGRVRTASLTGSATSFESLLVAAKSVRVSGDSGPNRLIVRACTTTAEGRAGDDTIVVDRFPHCKTVRHTVRGGTGNDRLLAGGGPDLLLGGPGRDLARGGAGVDSCEAETVRGCERRP